MPPEHLFPVSLPFAALACGAAALYGSADYVGGRTSRLVDARWVVLTSQLVGLLALFLALPWWKPAVSFSMTIVGCLVGACSIVSVTMLFRALATGPAVVVAPLAAGIGAAVPVAWSVVLGQRVNTLLAIAMAAIMVGIFSGAVPGLISRSAPRDSVRRAWTLPTVAAGLAAGVALGLLGAAARVDQLPWVLVCERVVVALALAVSLHRLPAHAGGLRDRKTWSAALVVGPAYVLASLAFAFSASDDQLGPAAVLTSLYPLVTVVWSLALDRTRLAFSDVVSGLLSLVGLILIGLAR